MENPKQFFAAKPASIALVFGAAQFLLKHFSRVRASVKRPDILLSAWT
jgi:hypothetical protein